MRRADSRSGLCSSGAAVSASSTAPDPVAQAMPLPHHRLVGRRMATLLLLGFLLALSLEACRSASSPPASSPNSSPNSAPNSAPGSAAFQPLDEAEPPVQQGSGASREQRPGGGGSSRPPARSPSAADSATGASSAEAIPPSDEGVGPSLVAVNSLGGSSERVSGGVPGANLEARHSRGGTSGGGANPSPGGASGQVALPGGPAPEGGGATNDAAEPASDPFDTAFRTLQTANVAFTSPEAMKGSESEMVELLIGFEGNVETLKGELEMPGRRDGAQVKVARKMMAQLTGSSFEITPVTPEEQVLLTSQPTRWLWEIKPTASGRLRLHLSLSALVSVDGETATRSLKTFEREIEVQVDWSQRTVSIVENNLEWFWAALVLPVTGFAWQWKRRKSA